MNAERYSVDLLGRKLVVSGEFHRLAPWLKKRWIFPQYQGLFTTDICVPIEVLASRPDGWPTRPTPSVDLGDFKAQYWQDPLTVYLEGEQCGLQYQVKPQYRLLFWGEMGPEAQVLLHNALTEIVACTGLFPLHASVASLEDSAVAFIGPSGRGKTTILRKALESGWRIVAEDTAWLDVSSQKILGWEKGVRILPQDIEQWQAVFPDLKPGPLVYGKHFVNYPQLGLEPQYSRLARFACLKHGTQTVWRELSAREAVLCLWEATGLPLHPIARESYSQMLSQIVRSFEVYELTRLVGDEPFSTMPPFDKKTTAPLRRGGA